MIIFSFLSPWLLSFVTRLLSLWLSSLLWLLIPWLSFIFWLATLLATTRVPRRCKHRSESLNLANEADDDSVSEPEAKFYYWGLPSNPRLVYRTGTLPWEMPTGPDARPEKKELRPVFEHKLTAFWEVLGWKIRDFLDSVEVRWTTIDVVRFIKVEKGKTIGPVILWIGVTPKTLSGKGAKTAAYGCLDILKVVEITDIEVEFRESVYIESAGPNFLEPDNARPFAEFCGPLTPALGLSISAQATSDTGGTGGLYLAEGGDSKNILLLTARHVLFPTGKVPNTNYARTNKSAPRRNVLLGTTAFDDLFQPIKDKIKACGEVADDYHSQLEESQERLVAVGGDDAEMERTMANRDRIQGLLDAANQAKAEIEEFHADVIKNWSSANQRIIGHVVRSPPITFGGKESFTQDYAIVELNSSKFKHAFRGNVIDLGTKVPRDDFKSMMHPSFKYPDDNLLTICGIIPEDEILKPKTRDYNGDLGITVIKSGKQTGVTIGRATGISSIVRKYRLNGKQDSMEWAILPYDKSRPFSTGGDSGSIIVDGHGRIGGLLTGGSATPATVDFTKDMTYATPFFWLWPRIKANGFPNAHLNPTA